uniref:alpha-L-fucosidase n=1 Tax=Magallana gigas TaxID=29159 RepID=K1RJH9_MAGGI|eukprot:XP_011419622.1 PREDICTED: alpha-L-fucosidase [Crassostrea gigas]
MVMMKFVVLALLLQIYIVCTVRYEPNWDSLDTRPLPEWYDKSKIGIFLHWGVFSVPAVQSAWFWYQWKTQKIKNVVKFMEDNYPPDFTYADFASQFHATFYNPDQWADLFEASGAKYVVLVTKHHEGFTLWPSAVSWNWNAYDVGPHRDLVGALADSIRNRTDIHFGVYHSLFEFYNPIYLQDVANNYTTQDYVRNKALPELYELINRYKPDVLWSDGSWNENSTYWNSTEFLAWLFNDSPVKDTVVTNDRWGKDAICKHGSFWNCQDKFKPGKIIKHKWESCMTIDKRAWTHRRQIQIEDVLTIEELLAEIAETVSYGGNILINVGPTADGVIIPVFEERLRQMGQWLKVNGEAIYETQPWFEAKDNITFPGVWYTTKKQGNSTAVYGIVTFWPQDNKILLGVPVTTATTRVTMLGVKEPLKWSVFKNVAMQIEFPVLSYNQMPCKWAWVIKMENLKNQ